jgi:hypothetical protein
VISAIRPRLRSVHIPSVNHASEHKGIPKTDFSKGLSPPASPWARCPLAEEGPEVLTLSLPTAIFAAVHGRPEAAFARGLLPFREEGLRAVLQDLAERVAQVRASAFMSTTAGIPSPSRATPRSRIEARRRRTYRVSPLRVVSQAPRASIQREAAA